MNLNTEKFNAMKIAYDLAFRKIFEGGTPAIYEQFAMVVGDAAHSTVDLPFVEQFACMREWIGPRQVKNISGKVLRLVERSFEDTVGVRQRDIETDNWGVYIPSIQAMAVAAKDIWDELATEALTSNGKWIDNKDFFAADRKYGKETINNKTTSALSVSTYKTARAAMMSYCGHSGKPLGVIPGVLMVGPALEFTARQILEQEFVSDGTTTVSNTCKGTGKVVVNPRLVGTYANYWFLMKTDGPIKPIVVQKSKEGALVSKNSPTDDGVFMTGQALFGTDAYGSAAGAFPHLVYGGIVSA